LIKLRSSFWCLLSLCISWVSCTLLYGPSLIAQAHLFRADLLLFSFFAPLRIFVATINEC
jgi:hypothetical protein